MPLQLSAEPLQFAAGQHGPAVLALQLVLLLHHLEQLLLQDLQLLLVAPVLLQLQKCDVLTYSFSLLLQSSAIAVVFVMFSPHSCCSFMQNYSFCSPAQRVS